MNADRLLEHYERIADAPDAIARLRRFIIDLAVSGNLVPQNANDEPAVELLKRIAKEKARMVTAGEIRRPREFPQAAHRELPFEVPSAWTWARFTEVAVIQSNLVDPRGYKSSPHIAPDNIESRTGRLLSYEAIGDSGVFSSKHLFKAGCLLYSKIRPALAKVTLVDFEGLCSADMYPLLPFVDRKYLQTFMLAEVFVRQSVTEDNRVAMPKINQESLSKILVAVPPLLEQHRIVAKVDELMALCDRLEAARAERETTRDRFASLSLDRLSAPNLDSFENHARFALDTLAAATARTGQVRQLRRAIINLAVRGKLVRQDPKDEPVSLAAAECIELSPDMPATWRYSRLANMLAEDTRNGYSRKPDDAPDGTPILRISAGTVRRDGVVAEEEHKLISGVDSEARIQYGLRPDDLLACRFNGNRSFVGRLTMFKDYLGIRPIYPDKLIRVRISPGLAVPAFVRLAGDADLVRSEIELVCATTVGNWGISASNLKTIQFPLPPLDEQRRIVAKVDELMALCDRLEASLSTAEDTRRLLLDAVLAEALTPPSAHGSHDETLLCE